MSNIYTIFSIVEDEFLHRLICPEREDAQFKLTPAYVVYVVARHRLLFPSQTVSIADSRTRLQLFLTKAANRFLLISKVFELVSVQ